MSDGAFYLPSSYLMWQAIYEQPYFWMIRDVSYRPIAQKNKGLFSEKVVFDFLSRIFPPKSLKKNVVLRRKNRDLGEIDILLSFRGYNVIFQIKSKSLTERSRSGVELDLRRDFESSFIKAKNQGERCVELSRDGSVSVFDGYGNSVDVEGSIETFILCVNSEIYPGISYQKRRILDDENNKCIFTDIFFIDYCSVLLDDPVEFIYFLRNRISRNENIIVDTEFSALHYHIRNKISSGIEYPFTLVLPESADIKAEEEYFSRKVLGVRRKPTTAWDRWENTVFGKVLRVFREKEDPVALEALFKLMDLSYEAAEDVSSLLSSMILQCQAGEKLKDTFLEFDHWGLGLYAARENPNSLVRIMGAHAELKAYQRRLDYWIGFGVSVAPVRETYIPMVYQRPWEYSAELEQVARENLLGGKQMPGIVTRKRKKLRRNDRCWCGSGRKYKHCHGK